MTATNAEGGSPQEGTDIRQIDLWECSACSVPNMNVGRPRECAHCGGDLDYLGEVDYRNLPLGRA